MKGVKTAILNGDLFDIYVGGGDSNPQRRRIWYLWIGLGQRSSMDTHLIFKWGVGVDSDPQRRPIWYLCREGWTAILKGDPFDIYVGREVGVDSDPQRRPIGSQQVHNIVSILYDIVWPPWIMISSVKALFLHILFLVKTDIFTPQPNCGWRGIVVKY